MKPSSGILKPLQIWKAILLFAGTSIAIYIGLYTVLPVLQSKGLTFLSCYLICFYTTFSIMFLLAFVFYWSEGNDLTLDAFKYRYRLEQVNQRTWLWAFGLFAFGIVTMFGFSFIGKLLASIPLLTPPGYFPSEINPLKAAIPNTFMGTEVHGQWGYAIGYFVGWFFNIFGEELLWRGYMLPRQQLQYGKWTWIIHGLLWTGWHFFWKWNLLSILPIALAIPFVAQKTRNSWIGIIAHGLLNLIPFVALVYFILN